MRDTILYILLVASGILNVILFTLWKVSSRRLSNLEDLNRKYNRFNS